MSVSEYEGPVIGVLPRSGEPIWQYGLREPDGTVTELSGTPRYNSRRMVRRPLVPAADWREVPDGDR